VLPSKTPATRGAATPNSGAPELQKRISLSDEKNGTQKALEVIGGRWNVCLLSAACGSNNSIQYL